MVPGDPRLGLLGEGPARREVASPAMPIADGGEDHAHRPLAVAAGRLLGEAGGDRLVLGGEE